MLATRRARFAIAALAATVVAGAGIAWAAIPGSDGVIHACYKDGPGALRVVDDPGSCRRHETAIDLGGPAHGYAAANPGDVAFSTPTSVSVLKLGLPAGTFLVHAKANLINLPGSDAVFVPCDLRGAGHLDDARPGPGGAGGAGDERRGLRGERSAPGRRHARIAGCGRPRMRRGHARDELDGRRPLRADRRRPLNALN